ncbi:helix-turn-helix transcriptional regulator [Natronomonas amylolytica]|uniref:helix-turn-helix transcriptional regulator n=1 Tax=Natronomonas amylolytica TaxID=3108498 RepID=UPI003008FD48
MNRGSVAALVAFVVLVATVAGTGVTAGSTVESSSAPALQEDINPDDVLMEVAVEEDGDAAWRIEYRMELDTAEDEQAFEDLQSDIESDPDPYVDRFHNRMNATADSAANATGREMAVTDVFVSATREELPQERGVVTFTFRWSNFAATDGDRLVVGDAIDGLFLDENSSLLISWPDEYALVDASPSATDTRDGAVSYDGPTNFASGEPRIELAPEGAVGGADGLPVVPLVVAAVVVLGLLAIGVVLVARRREGAADDESGADGPPDGGAGPDAATEADAADAEAGAAAPIDSDLLSNEEQVLQLIEQRGGRMKQQAVAEELGWTDAKTSQVTKGLREEGDLEGFRLGRENVLALPDEDSTEDADGEQ